MRHVASQHGKTKTLSYGWSVGPTNKVHVIHPPSMVATMVSAIFGEDDQAITSHSPSLGPPSKVPRSFT